MLAEYLSLAEQDSCKLFGSRLDFRLCEYLATGFPVTGMCEERDMEFSLLE